MASPGQTMLYPKFGVNYTFNFLDTVNVSWIALAVNDPDWTLLRLRYSNGTVIMSWNWSVPPPTSWLVPLSYIKPNQDVDAYLTFQQSTQGVRSGNLSVTHHPQQAPVLWNAYNGTDPLIIYNSSATTEASSPSLLQTSAAPSLIPSDGSDTTSLAQTSTVSLSSQVATALIPTSQIITTFLPQTSATTSLSQTKAGVLFHGGDDTTGGAPASPLSAGAKIGITIACVIGGLSLAAWLWTFIKMRKRNPPKQELDPIPGVVEESRDMVGRPEEEVYEINGREGQVELDSTSRHELEVRQRARELDSRERYELGVLNGALALPPELGCHGRDWTFGGSLVEPQVTAATGSR